MKRLIAALLLAVMLFSVVSCGTPADTTGDEGGTVTITVKVVHADKTEKTFTIETEGRTLLAALQQEGLVEGDDQSAGFYMTTVDGEKADFAVDQGWWCITKGGEPHMSGADTTPIADGETYELTYTIGF